MGNVLNNSVKYIAGVGEARAKLLEKELGIITIGDLLRHYPFRYIDRTKIYSIGELNENICSVGSSNSMPSASKRMLKVCICSSSRNFMAHEPLPS